MVERLARKARLAGDLDRGPIAHSVYREADVLLRLLILTDPGSKRAGECRSLQRIDRVDCCARLNGKIQLTHRAAADFRQKGIQLEFHGLGREHMLEESILLCEHTKQWQVGVVAHGKNVSALPLRIG